MNLQSFANETAAGKLKHGIFKKLQSIGKPKVPQGPKCCKDNHLEISQSPINSVP